MLNFNDVGFGYSGDEILRSVSFAIKNGEFVFLIGKSGSGKSTLLQLIYFNLLPDDGDIQFDVYSSQLIKASSLPLLRRKIGIIFQDFKLIEDRTIYENLAFVLETVNTPAKKIKKRITEVLGEVGLSHKIKSYPKELSGGEKQRIAIARAIINEPLLVLADEPTGNLDPETSLEILELLKKINNRGTAVLLATHNYELLKKSDARILQLENGVLKEIRNSAR
ncbi:MAG: ATP-binding cassette domain-containing protein [Ignavibacteriaceae bacterium]|jgi:cell division transport system ATP-binding protein